MRMGDYPQAVKMFEQALDVLSSSAMLKEHDPEIASAYARLAEAFRHAGELSRGANAAAGV